MDYSDRDDLPQFDEPDADLTVFAPRPKRLPLGRSRQRLSFERRLRVWLYCLGLPLFGLIVFEMQWRHVDSSIQ